MQLSVVAINNALKALTPFAGTDYCDPLMKRYADTPCTH